MLLNGVLLEDWFVEVYLPKTYCFMVHVALGITHGRFTVS